jgi:DNA-binding NarL/FixJ family response regulator
VPHRLLIADDNATARRLLRALVETREGWQVCGEADNGIEAVARAADLKPDIIILDLAMPIMDGLHAAQIISAASPTVPILMYTMHSFKGLDLEAKKVGIRKVISKTASGDALLSAVEEELKSTAPQTVADLHHGAAQQGPSLGNGAVAPSTKEVDPNSKLN